MIVNVTRSTLLATTPRVAAGFFSRLKGLLGTANLPEGAALIITPCSSVHTFGMAYPIDVLFVGADHRVLRVVASLQPGCIAGCRQSRYVIELPAGMAKTCQTQVGDALTTAITAS